MKTYFDNVNLDQMTEGYAICAFWSSQRDGSGAQTLNGERDYSDGEDFDDCTIESLDDTSLRAMRLDCIAFVREVQQHGLILDLLRPAYVGCTPSDYAGHNLWLTRNGHGAGFNDGQYTRGSELQDLARRQAERYLYWNEDHTEVRMEPNDMYTPVEMLAALEFENAEE